MTGTSGQRLLDELGVVRYRLRQPLPVLVAEPVPEPVADQAAAPIMNSEAPATAASAAVRVRLHLAVAEPATWPMPARVIWPQVLAWLGLEPGEVAWLAVADSRGLALPDPADWDTSAGRRGLWLALKHVAAGDLATGDDDAAKGRDHGRRAH